jgi:hypothetical protein
VDQCVLQKVLGVSRIASYADRVSVKLRQQGSRVAFKAQLELQIVCAALTFARRQVPDGARLPRSSVSSFNYLHIVIPSACACGLNPYRL